MEEGQLVRMMRRFFATRRQRDQMIAEEFASMILAELEHRVSPWGDVSMDTVEHTIKWLLVEWNDSE